MSVRLLIVDDEPAHQALMARAITTLRPDASVACATNVAQALALLSSAPTPLAAIVDLQLGQESGLPILSACQAVNVPAIAVSTSTLSVDVQACLAHGARCFVQKEGPLQSFAQRLEDALRKVLP